MKTFPRIKAIVIGSLLLPFVSCSDNTGSASTPDKAPISGLPSDATNIIYSVARGGPNTMYEFDTTEENFRKWVSEQKKPVMEPIQRKSGSILRYNQSSKSSELISIQDELISNWTGAQADEGQHMVYDLRKNRAYFWYHSR